MEILFYITGIITGISIIGVIYYRNAYNKQSGALMHLMSENISLKKYKENKESFRRKGKLTTSWHFSKEAKNPNRKEWDVVIELKEVAKSADDEFLIQFEPIKSYSGNTFELNDTYDYNNWFLSKYTGGWLDTKNNKDFEWISNTSKLEMRDDKLNDLGI